MMEETESQQKTVTIGAGEAFPAVVVDTQVPVKYTVRFTDDLFTRKNPLLADVLCEGPEPLPRKCLCFIDAGLAKVQPELDGRIRMYFEACADSARLVQPPIVLPGGEAAKNGFDVAQKVLELARTERISRHAFILAVGGGAFLDAVGLAAALVHRGVRLIRVPSTVLAQDDAGIGVKNGLNLNGAKNFIGTFAPPAAVLNDFYLLRTLPDLEWIAGIAEAFKVAVIKDAEFLAWLRKNAAALRKRDMAAMKRLIQRSAELHLEHIGQGGDPFEQGTARPLDFGHWSAHKLETLSNYELRHGEAVAIGMALDLCYAASVGFIASSDAGNVISAMEEACLPVWHPAMELKDESGWPLVLNGLEEFREHLGGELAITLPKPLGAKVEVKEMNFAKVKNAMELLRQRARLRTDTKCCR